MAFYSRYSIFFVSCIHHSSSQSNDVKVTSKAILPTQAWTGPEDSRRLRLPDFRSRNMKVVRFSVLRTGRFYPPGNITGTHFCSRLSRSQRPKKLLQWEISMTPSGIEPAIYRLVAQCRIYMYIYKHNLFIHLFQGICT